MRWHIMTDTGRDLGIFEGESAAQAVARMRRSVVGAETSISSAEDVRATGEIVGAGTAVMLALLGLAAGASLAADASERRKRRR
jgi:hypothetical protein